MHIDYFVSARVLTIEAFHVNCQIVLFLTHVYDTKKYLEKLFDKRFQLIFSSAFQ